MGDTSIRLSVIAAMVALSSLAIGLIFSPLQTVLPKFERTTADMEVELIKDDELLKSIRNCTMDQNNALALVRKEFEHYDIYMSTIRLGTDTPIRNMAEIKNSIDYLAYKPDYFQVMVIDAFSDLEIREVASNGQLTEPVSTVIVTNDTGHPLIFVRGVVYSD